MFVQASKRSNNLYDPVGIYRFEARKDACVTGMGYIRGSRTACTCNRERLRLRDLGQLGDACWFWGCIREQDASSGGIAIDS